MSRGAYAIRRRSAVLAASISVAWATGAAAGPFDCADATEPGPNSIGCQNPADSAYGIGLAQGFANSCGAELQVFFNECAVHFLARMSAPDLATPASAALMEQSYSYGYLHGQIGRDIPPGLTCESLPLVVTETDVGRLCIAEYEDAGR